MSTPLCVQPDAWFSATIVEKKDQPDGSVMVYGIPCMPGTLDVDGQKADPKWLRGALDRWYQTGANVREMHQPSAVGKGTELDWKGDVPYLTAKVVDDVAAKKVREDIYKAFSIGVKNHKLSFSDPTAPNGTIVGGDIVELTLCDRPAIPGSDILNFKGDLFKIAAVIDEAGTEVLDFQTNAVWKRVDAEKTTTEKRDFEPNVGGGVDRDKLPDSDFVFPDERAFPIAAPGDVDDAVSDWGRYRGGKPFDQFKERLTALAHRKGDEFAAALPNSWKQEEKVEAEHDTTEKTVEAAAEKGAEAEAEKTVETEEKAAEAEAEKATDDELSKAAAGSAFCAACEKTVSIEDGKTVDRDGTSFLVGKCAAGHEIRKYIPADAEKSTDADAEKTDEVDEAVKTVDVEEKAVETDAEKAVETDVLKEALGDGSILKTVLAELLLSEVGIDLSKIGRAMAKKRLDRFNSLCDEMKSLAAELNGDDGGDIQKSPALDDGKRTRLAACMKAVNELASDMAAGNGRFDLSDDHEKGDNNLEDSTASGLQGKRNLDLRRAVEPELVKALTQEGAAELLAKSVGGTLEKLVEPLLRRLEEVEHTTKPASAPVLFEVERRHELAKSTDAELAKTLKKVEFDQILGKLSQAEREQLAAAVMTAQRG